MLKTIRTFVLTGLLCLAPQVVAAQSNLPLVQASDISYVGSFDIPSDCGGSFFDYGGGGLGMGATSNSLYVAAYDQNRQVGEINIPAVGGTATVKTPCGYPIGIDNIAADAQVGGLLLWKNRLIVSGYSFYDGGGQTFLSHGGFDFNKGTYLRFTQFGTLGGGYVGGYMGVIPQEWRAALGGDVFTGQGSLSIIFRTSSGPSIHVFNPDDVGKTGVQPISTLMNYPLTHPLARTVDGERNTTYQRSDTIGGMAFPAGTRSVLAVGRHGFGPQCYGFGTSDPKLHDLPHPEGEKWCYDPADHGKGDHNYPYRYHMIAVDANQLVEVKAGKRQPHEVAPYAYWTLTQNGAIPADYPTPTGQIGTPEASNLRPGGATYDPLTRRLYVAIPRWNDVMKIAVFQIGTPVVVPVEEFTFLTSYVVPAKTITIPSEVILKTITCKRPQGGTWTCS